MYRLTVHYMNKPGATFDFPDDTESHMTVKATGHVYLTELGGLAAALKTHGAEIMGDVKNYSNGEPQLATERMLDS